MGLFLPIERYIPRPELRLSEPTQRVCAWCGAVEPLADERGATTHGLCRSCLEERKSQGESQPADAPDPEQGGGSCE